MIRSSGNRTLRFLLMTVFLASLLFASPAGAEGQAMLEAGTVVNARMKSLAAGADTGSWKETADIKAIRMADSLPDGFVPSEANTVSVPESENPIYIFFDNSNDAGIMYFYTAGDTVVMNPNSRTLFFGHTALTDISGLAGWDASRVTDMGGMFEHVKSLRDAFALRNWDVSGVTDMSFMFSRAESLMFIDVSGWNTGKVTTMCCMFQVGNSWEGNGQLVEILGLGGLDVSNVRDMTCMFYGAGQMTYYDIGNWNVSKVESMNHMFGDNFKLRSLDLSAWDVSSLRTIYCMFDDNVKLRTIGDVSHWNTANLVDAGAWLNDSSSFVGDNTGTFDLSGWDTRNLKSTGEMLLHTSIRTLDLSGWTFDSITNEKWEGAGKGAYYETGNDTEALKGMGSMFKNSSKLTAVYISQEGLDSYNAAVERGVNTLEMWEHTKVNGFTVR